MTYTVGICDDNAAHISVIREYLRKFGGDHRFDIIESTSPVGFLLLIENRRPDFVFLDIDMGDHNGIDIGKEIRRMYGNELIIYTTAHPKYAAEAFEVRAFHYLIKPITPVKFYQVLEEVLVHMDYRRKMDEPKQFVIKTKKEIISVDFDKINYFEKEAHRIWVRGDCGDLHFYDNFANLLQSIDDREFQRCHQGYIVNMNKVRSYSAMTLHLAGGIELPVSRTYAKAVKDSLAQRLFGIGDVS